MRIAAKRLRYVLEITESCFGARGRRPPAAPPSELQAVLGDIHDCDVMLPRVEGIALARGPAARPAASCLFRRFRELWQAEASKGTWAALERSL